MSDSIASSVDTINTAGKRETGDGKRVKSAVSRLPSPVSQPFPSPASRFPLPGSLRPRPPTIRPAFAPLASVHSLGPPPAYKRVAMRAVRAMWRVAAMALTATASNGAAQPGPPPGEVIVRGEIAARVDTFLTRASLHGLS